MYQAMASSKEFSSSYMVLKPEKVSLFGLLHMIFSSHIDKMKFVELPEGTKLNLQEHRWIIFISVLVQMILQFVAKPLSWFGSVLEWWLNLLSSNHNFIWLLLNFIRGKVVIPDKTSATFSSVVGHLDHRVELDKSIKPGDSRYYGALSIMAAKASYENKAYIEAAVKDHWKMEFLGSDHFWNDYEEKYTTHAFILQDKKVDPNMIIVAFRGTDPFNAYAWCEDVNISWFDVPGVGKIHSGFMKALGLQKDKGWPKEIEQNGPTFAYYAIREKLRQLLRANKETKFIVTGHSLGGALAILFPAILVLHEEAWMLERLQGVYTFGQPRVGDDKFGEFMVEKLKAYGVQYYRFVYSNDIVPRLPFDDSAFMFKHFGPCLFFNSCYKGKILPEEPNKNYFSPFTVIPKTINAVWELIRSFIIPYAKGGEYREGCLLRVFRVIGLVFDGLPDHLLQDYDNATRLGSARMFLPHQHPPL